MIVMVQVADLSHENFKSSRVMRWWLSRLSNRFGAKSSRERKPKWLPVRPRAYINIREDPQVLQKQLYLLITDPPRIFYLHLDRPADLPCPANSPDPLIITPV